MPENLNQSWFEIDQQRNRHEYEMNKVDKGFSVQFYELIIHIFTSWASDKKISKEMWAS